MSYIHIFEGVLRQLQLPCINIKISCKYSGLKLYLFLFFTLSNMLDFAYIISKMRTDSHILSCCSVSMHLKFQAELTC